MLKSSDVRRALVVIGCGAILALAFFAPISSWWREQQARAFVRGHGTVTSRPLEAFEWRGVAAMKIANYGAALTLLKHNGYATIFVSFDENAAAANGQSYEQSLNSFGALLAQHGLRLALVAGDPSWAKSTQWPAIASAIAFAQMYNDTFAHRISAVELDIEPYKNSNETAQAANALANTAAFVAESEQGSTIPIGFTAPFWLTQNPNEARAFLRSVGALNGGFVTIMDYRTAVYGANDSLALAAPFFTLVHGTHTDLFIALNAVKSLPSETTFYGQSTLSLRLAQYRIDQAERGQSAYAGQALNDVQSLTQLH